MVCDCLPWQFAGFGARAAQAGQPDHQSRRRAHDHRPGGVALDDVLAGSLLEWPRS